MTAHGARCARTCDCECDAEPRRDLARGRNPDAILATTRASLRRQTAAGFNPSEPAAQNSGGGCERSGWAAGSLRRRTVAGERARRHTAAEPSETAARRSGCGRGVPARPPQRRAPRGGVGAARAPRRASGSPRCSGAARPAVRTRAQRPAAPGGGGRARGVGASPTHSSEFGDTRVHRESTGRGTRIHRGTTGG